MAKCTKSRPHRLILPEDRCHRELVLALDGGGMRGYSSLLLIEALMAQVAEAERGHNMSLDDDTITSLVENEQEPLPSHYFDYAIGTSTGGLIAIMLGRLRMRIADCLKEYELFGDSVFGKRRLLRWNQYDYRKLEAVLQKVIEKYSKEKGQCALFTLPDPPRRSCRSAVMAVRRNPDAGDEAYIFRSYNFTGTLQEDKPLDQTRPLNPEGNGLAYVWQAARATSAAPHFFRDIAINGNRFMDGGVQMNNPSFKAWTEVCAMHHGKKESDPLTDKRKPVIGVFVSIGTGKSAPLTMFNDKNIIRHMTRIGKAAIKRLSNPEETHVFMSSMFAESEVQYFRFNVQNGLENIKMDDSRKETIHRVNIATKEYLDQPEVKKELRRCAELLVAHRRGRNPTEEESRIRDLHQNIFDTNDFDSDNASSSTFRCSVCHSLSTPESRGRSRSNSGLSSASAAKKSVRADKRFLDVSHMHKLRHDSGASSSSSCVLTQREDECPASRQERAFTKKLWKLR